MATCAFLANTRAEPSCWSASPQVERMWGPMIVLASDYLLVRLACGDCYEFLEPLVGALMLE
eukprot:1583134-Amphidinium_carterae.1